MKTPKRIKSLIDKKQAFIDAATGKMDRFVVKIQSQLLSQIIDEVIPNLDVKDGVIQDTPQNYRILSDFDRVYSDFMKQTMPSIGKEVAGTVGEITSMGESYFRMVLTEDLGKNFDKVISGTTELMNARIGLKGEKTVSGGFLESIFKNGEIPTKAKDYIAKSITGQVDQKEFLKGLSELVNGKEGSMGALEKQYQRYGYDLYQQYDRAYNKNLAEQFELEYFIYQGTLVGESRDFCVAHVGKVYSTKEAEEWKEWTPSKGEYPEGYEIQQKDIYAVPSYMNYPGYNPLVDCGGYRCRHAIAYVPEELAKEMRPELEKKISD